MTKAIVERLHWQDPVIVMLEFPGGTMTLRHGFGSGLAMRSGDPAGHFWALGDRGPNIKVRDAIRRYGLADLAALVDVPGAKVMPRLDIGPALAELRIVGDAIELVRIVAIQDAQGKPITGLANPGSDQLLSEPVFDLAGHAIAPDPDGLDTEGLVALGDGRFWVGDEFGPSIVQLDANGTVLRRLLPAGSDGPHTAGSLPAIAAKRQINRGFEALAISGDERFVFLAFQSPLAHPDEAAHRQARHVRIWRLDAETGACLAQYAYPLDPPETFARDMAADEFARSDIKVSELLWLAEDTLLVLERGSATTKLYRCSLDSGPLDDKHLELATRPTLEELSARDGEPSFPVVNKTLVFSSDDHPQVTPDLEGMVRLSPTQLLLVNDNDFGVESAETVFWRVTLPQEELA